jgi:flagellar biosynthetic protein FliR
MRVAPVFAFAPPFSLVRAPRAFRLLFGLGLATCLISGQPGNTLIADQNLSHLLIAGVHELLLGLVFVLAFQVVFGALYFAGRTLDIQAGFGFAVVVDPATKAQSPLIGTLFAFAAGAVFFSFDGHIELVRMFSSSLQAIPVGTWMLPHSPERLAVFMCAAFSCAFGIAGATILVLFLTDIVIALLCRTVPQMNVLILGFQVKTLILILVLPTAFGLAGAQFLRLMSMALQAIPRIV